MSIPNDLRQMNRRQLVLASLKSGPSTRSALAKFTGISTPTTGKIIEELLDEGILRSTAARAVSSGPGRPGKFIKIDDVQPRFLAVHLDAGRTYMAPLAVAPVLRDVWSKSVPTGVNLADWVDAVATAARPLLREKLTGLLVSVPGVIDSAGCVLASSGAHWTEGHNVAAALGEALAMPAQSVQAAAALALGQHVVDPSADTYLLVDFGATVQAAAVLRGQLFVGGLPTASDIGHSPVPGNADLCDCGAEGCLNTLASRPALFPASDGAIKHGDDESLSALETGTLADPERAAHVERAIAAAGSAIASFMNALGLSHVVVTGFVADLPPELFAVLRHQVMACAMAGRFGLVRVDASPRHRLAGLASVGIDRVIAPA